MTGNEEEAVRDLLVRASDDLPAWGAVPADLLVARGERVVRRRRRFAVAAAGMVAAIAVLGSAMLVDGVRPASQPSPAASQRSGPPSAAPDRFDPAKRLFRLGWLPDGIRLQSFETDPWTQWIMSAVPRPKGDLRCTDGWVRCRNRLNKNLERIVEVQIGARGVDIFAGQRASEALPGRPGAERTAGRMPLPGAEVAAIADKPAYLDTSPDGLRTLLSWRYAPDGWISISLTGFDQPEAIARRVADGLIWEAQPVTVPFLPVATPAGARLHRVVVDTFDDRWKRASLRYLAPSTPDTPQSTEDFGIGVSNGEFVKDVPDFRTGGTAVIDSAGAAGPFKGGVHVLRMSRRLAGCTGCVGYVDALSVAGLAALGGKTGWRAFPKSIRMVVDPDDPAGWWPV